MKEIFYSSDFDVDYVTEKITEVMSRWSIGLLDMNGPTWVVYNYDMEVKYVFYFEIEFMDLESRIKLEDLKLNVIHFIGSLKDETSYKDNLISEVFFEK